MVDEVLFHPVMLQKFQGHPRRMWACVIRIHDQLSIVSTCLSFAPIEKWNKDISNVMAAIEFDPL
jgi:hypothetical protein